MSWPSGKSPTLSSSSLSCRRSSLYVCLGTVSSLTRTRMLIQHVRSKRAAWHRSCWRHSSRHGILQEPAVAHDPKLLNTIDLDTECTLSLSGSLSAATCVRPQQQRQQQQQTKSSHCLSTKCVHSRYVHTYNSTSWEFPQTPKSSTPSLSFTPVTPSRGLCLFATIT